MVRNGNAARASTHSRRPSRTRQSRTRVADQSAPGHLRSGVSARASANGSPVGARRADVRRRRAEIGSGMGPNLPSAGAASPAQSSPSSSRPSSAAPAPSAGSDAAGGSGTPTRACHSEAFSGEPVAS